MKISLALSGGAARGAFHLGVMARLEEMGIEIGAISGTSIGAIIAVGFSSGLRPKAMLEIFKSKAFQKSITFNYFQKSVFKIDTDNQVLRAFAPIDNLEDLKIPTFVTCVDLLSGQIKRFNQGKVVPLCIASSALIPLFRPVHYENYLLIDGGFMDNLPIAPLKDFVYPIVSVDLHPLVHTQKTNFFSLWKRALFLSFVASSQKQIAESTLYITSPQLPTFGLFGFSELDACFMLGYQSVDERTLTFLS